MHFSASGCRDGLKGVITGTQGHSEVTLRPTALGRTLKFETSLRNDAIKSRLGCYTKQRAR